MSIGARMSAAVFQPLAVIAKLFASQTIISFTNQLLANLIRRASGVFEMPRWTDEARARQAALIREWRPWEQSTGPVTRKGKRKTVAGKKKIPAKG